MSPIAVTIVWLVTLLNLASQVICQSQNREIDLNLFFTETQITGNNDLQEKCSETVLNSRISIQVSIIKKLGSFVFKDFNVYVKQSSFFEQLIIDEIDSRVTVHQVAMSPFPVGRWE